MASSSQADECIIAEKDPTGQYARYNFMIEDHPPPITLIEEVQVYKGFDMINGREICWSKAELRFINHKILCKQVHLLWKLNNENIMKCYHFWVDNHYDSFVNLRIVCINMITDLFTDNLRGFTKKHLIVDTAAVKNWCRQILSGLDYLQNLNSPIIHRDLNCENIFVLGSSGRIKLGVNLENAMVLEPGKTVMGNADAEAAERTGVYCFGMCVLRMVIKEVVFNRPTDWITMLPDEVGRVTDSELRGFIKKCLSPESVRPTVAELLKHPFLESSTAASGGSSEPGCSSSSSSSSNPNVRASASWDLPPLQRIKVVHPEGSEIRKELESDDMKYILQGKLSEEKDCEKVSMNFSYVTQEKTRIKVSLKDYDIPVIMAPVRAKLGRKMRNSDVEVVTPMIEKMIEEFKPEVNSRYDAVNKALISRCVSFLRDLSIEDTSGDARQQTIETSNEQNQAENRSQPNQDVN